MKILILVVSEWECFGGILIKCECLLICSDFYYECNCKNCKNLKSKVHCAYV